MKTDFGYTCFLLKFVSLNKANWEHVTFGTGNLIWSEILQWPSRTDDFLPCKVCCPQTSFQNLKQKLRIFAVLLTDHNLQLKSTFSILNVGSTSKEERGTSLQSLDCLKESSELSIIYFFSVLIGNPRHLCSLALAVDKNYRFTWKALKPWLSVAQSDPAVGAEILLYWKGAQSY